LTGLAKVSKEVILGSYSKTSPLLVQENESAELLAANMREEDKEKVAESE